MATNKKCYMYQNCHHLLVVFNVLVRFIVVILVTCIPNVVINTECPHLCECKWKNGKESVFCLSANLSSVPLHLDGGTQVLDLTGNNIVTVIHDEFSKAGLVNLQKVYMGKCRIKTLDRYAFRHLINLIELDLSYNALVSVPSHVFDSITELRELKLSGNPIQRIVNEAFVHVSQLVRLELSNCRIGTLEPRSFSSLENSLEWLHLDGNRLVEIRPSNTLTALHSLHGVELAGNPWNCSCTLRPLREWMLRHNVPYGIPPVCNSPERLAGRNWDRLELDEFACPPAIEAPIALAHGIEGRNVTISCKVGGVPRPNVRWILKNRVIANLSSVNNNKKMYVLHLHEKASNLTILTADVQDAGVYVCAAENKAGKAEASVTLAVSRRSSIDTLGNGTGRRLFVIVIVGAVVLILAASVFIVCVCGVRKRRQTRNNNGGGNNNDDQRCVSENYDKIEMNNKTWTYRVPSVAATISNMNNVGSGRASLVPTSTTTAASMLNDGIKRRRGDYRGVPDTDDEEDEDDERLGGMNGVSGGTYDEDIEMTPISVTRNGGKFSPSKKRWTSSYSDEQQITSLNVANQSWRPHHLLREDSSEPDLHIPRRTGYNSDNRDDCSKTQITTHSTTVTKSTSGTFNKYNNIVNSDQDSSISLVSGRVDSENAVGNNSGSGGNVSNGHPRALHPHLMRKHVLENGGGSLYSTVDIDHDNGKDDASAYPERNYPDLLELSSATALFGMRNIDNLNCTLPRKQRSKTNSTKTLSQDRSKIYSRASARCHNSTDSEAPLLSDSRYSSSGGEDDNSLLFNSNRRLSVENYPTKYSSNSFSTNHQKQNLEQRSNSYLNLSTTSTSIKSNSNQSSSILLNVNDLDKRNNSNYMVVTSPETSSNANTYDYHAAQLERFLEEYRSLQEQLNKMKETCEGIKTQKQTIKQVSKEAPHSLSSNSKFRDPLLYNNFVTSPSDVLIEPNYDILQPRSILKNKVTPTLLKDSNDCADPTSNTISLLSPLALTPGDANFSDVNVDDENAKSLSNMSPLSNSYTNWLSRNTPSLTPRFNGNTTTSPKSTDTSYHFSS